LKINKKDIAWKSDKTGKFGSDVHPKNFQTEGLIGGGKLDEQIPVSIIFKQVLLVLFSEFLRKIILFIFVLILNEIVE
jgi:hypothetical protein